MNKKLFLLAGLSALLTLSSFAQTSYQVPVSMKIGGGGDIDDFTRPRRVEEKAAGVRSSVVVNTATVERVAFDMLNAKRVENGLAPLAWNDHLAAAARVHSQNMAEFSFFSHKGLDGKMVSHRADENGVGKWRSIGENIAYNRGYGDPVTKAVQLWLDSPSHRQNLLDATWRESAVGVAIAPDGSYYFTQVFLVRR